MCGFGLLEPYVTEKLRAAQAPGATHALHVHRTCLFGDQSMRHAACMRERDLTS